MQETIKEILKQKEEYCQKCINEIKDVINKKKKGKKSRMEILLICFITIFTTLCITMLILGFMLEAITERFETEDKIDLMFKSNICNIYDIINYNDLAKPNKEDKKMEER